MHSRFSNVRTTGNLARLVNVAPHPGNRFERGEALASAFGSVIAADRKLGHATLGRINVSAIGDTYSFRTSLILSVARKVLLSLGNDAESRQALFDSISNTFQEFVIEYAELMTEDEERLKDLKKILRWADYSGA